MVNGRREISVETVRERDERCVTASHGSVSSRFSFLAVLKKWRMALKCFLRVDGRKRLSSQF